MNKLPDEFRIRGPIYLLRNNISGDRDEDIGIVCHSLNWGHQHPESYMEVDFISSPKDFLVSTNRFKIGDVISLQLVQMISKFSKIKNHSEMKKKWALLSRSYNEREIVDQIGPEYNIRGLMSYKEVIGELKIFEDMLVLDIGIPLVLSQHHHDFPNTLLSQVNVGDWIKLQGGKLFGEFIRLEKKQIFK